MKLSVPKVQHVKRNLDRLASKSLLAINEHLLSEKERKKCEVYGNDASTPSRSFARFMSSRFSLYYPKRSDGADLDAAWGYWENVTLARIYSNFKDKDGNLVRAKVGDSQPTTLYPYWQTSLKDLNTFGISVRMYFDTLLIVGSFLLVAGFLNLPLISYYYWNYSEGNKEGVQFVLKSSAICNKYEWVECESCNNEYQDYFNPNRLDGENVLKTICNFDDWLYAGIQSWVVSMMLIVAFYFAFDVYQTKAEIVFDEEIQTTSDYSIKIVNPPSDSFDPEEWRDFFNNFTDEGIVSVTINLDNAELLTLLVKRRKIIQQLKKLLPTDADWNDQAAIRKASARNFCNKLPIFANAQAKYKKVQQLNNKIKLLAEKEYKVSDVFVIFESERGQRNCLHCLSTGRLNAWRNSKPDITKFVNGQLTVNESSKNARIDNLVAMVIEEEETEEIRIKLAHSSDHRLESLLLFRGEKVLRIKEAPEPFDVRWKDLQVKFHVRFIKCTLTFIVLVWFISWSGFFIHALKKVHPGWTAVFISMTNVLVPKICEFINRFEPHATEGKRQASLYVKMALFRCFNSAIALILVTNFAGTISVESGKEEGTSLLFSVYSVIFAELLTIPIIKLCDPMGNWRKHFKAPRARSQEEMNACMRGAKFELAERYTDSTKVIFVALMYSSILPQSLFLGAIACFIHYFFGKFCLLRMWRKAPDIGRTLSRISRHSFFKVSLLVHLLASAYFWSGFPYDFVCGDDDEGYEFCNQDILSLRTFPLPRFQPELNWMSSSQEKIVSLYGWSSLVLGMMTFILFSRNSIAPAVSSIFKSTYEPDGRDQGKNFHEVIHTQEVQAYIPQIIENGFEYPLIACDIDEIEESLLGWNDHLYGFSRHNLTNDVKEILGDDLHKPIFSIVKYWHQQS